MRRTQARRERARDTAGAEEQPAEEVVKGCNSVPVYLKAARANYVLQMEFQTVNAPQRIRELFLLPYFFYNLMPMPKSFVTSWLEALSRPVRLNKRSARSEFDMWSRDVMSPTSVPECWTIYHLKSSLCVNVT